MAAALISAGCSWVPVPSVDLPGPGSGNEGTERLVENRVWIDAEGGAAPGAFRAFLADGTYLSGSCADPARLAAWRWVDEGRLVWEAAGGGTVRAEVVMVGPRELVLVAEPAAENTPRRFRRAQAPEACG